MKNDTRLAIFEEIDRIIDIAREAWTGSGAVTITAVALKDLLSSLDVTAIAPVTRALMNALTSQIDGYYCTNQDSEFNDAAAGAILDHVDKIRRLAWKSTQEETVKEAILRQMREIGNEIVQVGMLICGAQPGEPVETLIAEREALRDARSALENKLRKL